MTESRMPKVMVIGRSLPSSSSSYGLFEYNQAVALSKRALDVTYCFVDGRSVKVNRMVKTVAFNDGNLSVHGKVIPFGGLPLKAKWNIRGRALCRLLEEEMASGNRPDIVYVHFPLLSIAPSFLKRLHTEGIALLCMEHWSHVQRRVLNQDQGQFLRECVAQSAYYCCVSEDLAASVRALTGCDAQKTPVIPNMVSEELFYPPRVCEKAGSGGERCFSFLAAGRLAPNKRFDMLIDAFSRASIPEGRLLIAGAGECEGRIKRRVASLGLGDRVSLLGWKTPEEIAALLRSCDCYVSASGDETFGVPFVEAWMCGVPCIGADSNPLSSYFAEGAGMLFARDSVLSLAECLTDMRGRQGSFDAAGLAEKAAALFSEEAVCSSLERMFRDVVGEGGDSFTFAKQGKPGR